MSAQFTSLHTLPTQQIRHRYTKSQPRLCRRLAITVRAQNDSSEVSRRECIATSLALASSSLVYARRERKKQSLYSTSLWHEISLFSSPRHASRLKAVSCTCRGSCRWDTSISIWLHGDAVWEGNRPGSIQGSSHCHSQHCQRMTAAGKSRSWLGTPVQSSAAQVCASHCISSYEHNKAQIACNLPCFGSGSAKSTYRATWSTHLLVMIKTKMENLTARSLCSYFDLRIDIAHALCRIAITPGLR